MDLPTALQRQGNFGDELKRHHRWQRWYGLRIVPLRLGSGAVQTFGIHGQQGRAVQDKRLRNAGRRAERDLRVPGWCNSSVGLVAGPRLWLNTEDVIALL